MGELAGKPGSVVDSHSSRGSVAATFKQPTRTQRGPRQRVPIWSCSEWGLPCHALLPGARCALTAPFHPYRPPKGDLGGLLSAALSVGSRRPGVTWHSALWSPDFPPPHKSGGDCLANSRGKHTSGPQAPQSPSTENEAYFQLPHSVFRSHLSDSESWHTRTFSSRQAPEWLPPPPASLPPPQQAVP